MYVEYEVDFMTERSVESMAEVVIDLKEKKPIRVLHVDDEPCLLKIAKQCLEMEGRFHVDTASSVEQALEKIKKELYDAIISDYQMPGKEGLEFLKELRENGSDIPFIIFTGKGREELVIKALNLGADHYVNKNGDPETVYAELKHVISETVRIRKAEEALGQSEEKYRNLVENSKDSVAVIDLRGNVQFVNKATEELTGYNMKEGIGMNVKKITPLRYWPKSLAMLFQAKGGKPIPYFESVIKRKDGRLVPVESTGQAIIKNGKVVGLQIITRDISERKKTEEALRESMEGYRELAESISDMFFAMDKDFRYTYWNKACEEFTGISAKDAIGN